jgi:septal ring factor EnvC (AmiA/AmiB activator)
MRICTLMVALALCTSGGCSDRARSEELAKQAAHAEQAAKQAAQEAKEAQDRVEKLASDLADLDSRLKAATDALIAAQNDADRNAARASLDKVRRDKLEIEQRIRAERAAAERATGVHRSKECLENPLAKGCS